MDFQISQLFQDATSKNYSKNQILIYEGDPVSSLYYIKNGYVKVYNILNNGTERIIFIYGPGDFFPLSTYLSGSRVMRYFYVCMSDVEVQEVLTKKFEQKIKNNIRAGEALVGYTNSINQQFFQRIEILSVNDARRKVIALLAFLVKKAGSKESMSKLDVPLTQQDIANMSGLTRESTSRQLVRLKKEGLLLGENGSMVINVNKLNSLTSKLAIVI